MQLGMAIPPEEMARRQAAGPGIKDVLWAVGQKATGKRPRQQCSQPVDADELRKRLYMVLSQQERQKERKLLAMIEEATQRAAEEEEEAAAAKRLSSSASRSWKPTGIVRGTSVKAPESLGMIRDSMRKSSEDPSTSSSRRRTQESQRVRAGSNNSSNNNSTSTRVASEPQHQQQGGPYVPQEAALQFARTATPMQTKVGSDRNKIHELSHEALRIHTEGPSLDTGNTLAGARALRKVQSEREKLRARNQFQSSGAIEETPVDRSTSPLQSSTQRYTIPNEGTANKRFSLRWSMQHHDLLHMVKTGESDMEQLARHESHPAQQQAHDHRMVDWTQSDETAEDKRQRHHGLRSPLLKRADSLWGLKDKLGSKSGHEQQQQQQPQPQHNTTSSGGDLAERVDAIMPKPVKRGIWTKFRRHAATVRAA